jgi:hypothetical protein
MISTPWDCQAWAASGSKGVLVGLGPGVMLGTGEGVRVSEGTWVGIGCKVGVKAGLGVRVRVGMGEGAGWQALRPRRKIVKMIIKAFCIY